ncbi:MAG TPA: tRNA (adenosine(37)-N6)-dimethylallyltransferase MiaA [Candidatus Hydrogenedentes bacterium]|nr:tRNA (adenosine(37)-N6)-dimethylallyltransferase MiaA [Candidatus Hydrogenedentota bacterium]
MDKERKKTLVVLGPTASGKTRLGVQLAHVFDGEILSADSRQVYRGLDIGSGKDLNEYVVDGEPILYHLIDLVDLDTEFNVFMYQKAFFEALENVQHHGKLPVVVGGTGLYLEAVLKGYRMVEAPENPVLRAELSDLSLDQLAERLRALKPDIHNTTDIKDRGRCIRAIEIAAFGQTHTPEPTPPLHPLVLGARWPRPVLLNRISKRLKERLDTGLIEEVEHLHDYGYSWQRLGLLGLEYRFVSQYLQGLIKNRNDLFQKLNAAIAQFAKRQETWFRRMERNGVEIHWIDRAHAEDAIRAVREFL